MNTKRGMTTTEAVMILLLCIAAFTLFIAHTYGVETAVIDATAKYVALPNHGGVVK